MISPPAVGHGERGTVAVEMDVCRNEGSGKRLMGLCWCELWPNETKGM